MLKSPFLTDLWHGKSGAREHSRPREPPHPTTRAFFYDAFNSPLNKNDSIIQIGGRLPTNGTRRQIKRKVYICALYKLHAGLIFQSMSVSKCVNSQEYARNAFYYNEAGTGSTISSAGDALPRPGLKWNDAFGYGFHFYGYDPKDAEVHLNIAACRV